MVVCPGAGDFVDALKADSFETKNVLLYNLTKSTIIQYILSVLRIWDIIRLFKPNIIHCNSATVAQIAIPAAWLFGIPVVVHIRNDILLSEAQRYLVTKATRVISNSSFTGAHVKTNIDPQKWHVIYNPIELYEYTKEPVYEGVPTVLFVGQITPHKGLEILIKIAERIKRKYQDTRFIVVGDECEHSNGYMQIIQNIAKDTGVMAMFTFTGQVTDVNKYYATASLVVVPSKKEPFGRVAAEAMMHGLPVVASMVGGLPEVVEDNVTGFLVDPNDVDGFAEKVKYLLNNPEKARAMGRVGRERAIKLFSPKRHADQIMAVFKALQK